MKVAARKPRLYLPEKPAPGESLANMVTPLLLTTPFTIARRIVKILPKTHIPARAALRAATITLMRHARGVEFSARHALTCEKQLTYTFVPNRVRCVCSCGADLWL